MKVAIINQPFGVIHIPNPGSGISIWTYEVARRLARRCDVLVYTRRGTSQTPVETSEGVQYRRISGFPDTWLLKVLRSWWRIRHVRSPIFDASLYYRAYIWKIARDLAGQRCDIVHLHNFSQFVPVIRACDPNVKIVLHMHGEWLTQLDPPTIAERLRMVDLIVGCSEYLTDKIRRRFPQFAERCRTIPNGVDVDCFVRPGGRAAKTNGDRWRLLFVGRISPEKGLHVLLEAFGRVLRHDPCAELEIVGPEWVLPTEFLLDVSDDPKVLQLRRFYNGSSYLAQLQARLPESVAARVTFPGLLTRKGLVGHYRRADMLINPSLSESFGMSLIEAMACQVPVLATRVGGMTEIVEQARAGLLVKPDDPGALADAILHLLGDDSLRQAFGRAGREAALQRFAWERVTECVWDCYRNIGKFHA